MTRESEKKKHSELDRGSTWRDHGSILDECRVTRIPSVTCILRVLREFCCSETP
jgi:hypothetical protein